MKKTRTLSAFAAVFAAGSIFLGGCASNQGGASGSGGGSSSSTATGPVRILTGVTGGKTPAGMQAFQDALSKATGLTVTMEQPASDYNNVLMQKLQAGEKYDLIYLDQSMLPSLVQQGAVKDLTADVKKSKTLSDTGNIPQSEWDAIKVNGKIYAGFNKKEVERVVNVNSVVASKAGADASKIEPTLDGYTALFEKEKAYNDSTAKVAGFYPLNIALSAMFDLQPWFSSIGLKGGIVEKDGKRTVPWSTDAAAPVWQWLNKLYTQGLLDKDCLTDQTKQLRNKFQSGQTGTVVDWAAWTGLYNVNAGSKYPTDFKAEPLPGTKKSGGDYMLTRGAASLWSIPVNASNPAGALKVLEYFATPEGGILLSLGAEGYDYTKSGSTYTLTDAGKSAGMDHGAPFPISSKYKNPIGYNPGVDQAVSYLKYATIEPPSTYTSSYTTIVAKYGAMMVKGDVGVSDGLKQMRAELQQAQVTN